MPVRTPRRRSQAASAALLAASVAAGCASRSGPSDGAVEAGAADRSAAAPPGAYAQAFDAAKDVLRDAGFVLARVDALEGLIVTAPLASSGFATPWIGAEATLADGMEAVANVERRVVEVRFRSAGHEGGPSPAPDSVLEDSAVTAEVSAWVVRVRSPGRRVESASIRLTTFASDARTLERGWEPDVRAVERDDFALAAKIADRLRSALTSIRQ